MVGPVLLALFLTVGPIAAASSRTILGGGATGHGGQHEGDNNAT
jgi:hypothetical protein